MKPYVSIDIETTGLDPDTCQILEIGAVIDDWTTPVDELPVFHCYIDNGEIVGQPYALAMNTNILRAIAERKGKHVAVVASCLWNWLCANGLQQGPDTFAGKNFAKFDLQFLKYLPGWDRLEICHRSIDPGMLFWNPAIDNGVPSTEVCMERAGLTGPVAHTAVEDAKTVVELIRIGTQRLDTIVDQLAEQGYCLELYSTGAKYSARFMPVGAERRDECESTLPTMWNDFVHGDTVIETVRAAALEVRIR